MLVEGQRILDALGEREAAPPALGNDVASLLHLLDDGLQLAVNFSHAAQDVRCLIDPPPQRVAQPRKLQLDDLVRLLLSLLQSYLQRLHYFLRTGGSLQLLQSSHQFLNQGSQLARAVPPHASQRLHRQVRIPIFFMQHQVSLDAFRTKRLEALALDAVIVARLFGVEVAEQFDGLELDVGIGVARYLRDVIHLAVLSRRKRSLVDAEIHIMI